MQASGMIDAAMAQRLIEHARGVSLNVHALIRALMYGAVFMIVAGAGTLAYRHYQQWGPLGIFAALVCGAAVCYIPTARAHSRRAPRSNAADYLLLLAASLASTAAIFARLQFGWLAWLGDRDLLLLALFHAAIGYVLRSRIVLTAALASLTAWFGIDLWRAAGIAEPSGLNASLQSFKCAAIIALWYAAHRRWARNEFTDTSGVESASPTRASLGEPFEHFIVNLMLLGSLSLCLDPTTRLIGAVLLAAFAAAVVALAYRLQRESFVIYAVLYAAAGFTALERMILHDFKAASIANLVTLIAASAVFISARRRIQAAVDV